MYVDACAFIDLAKFKANKEPSEPDAKKGDRERDVWLLERALDAARAGAIRVFTSSLSVVECSHLKISTEPRPDPATQRFFSELLLSGKSGVTLVQPVLAIIQAARDLRWKRNFTFKPIDSLHVATALHMQCREILTSDGHMHRVSDQLAQLNLSVTYPRNATLVPEAFLQSDFLRND